MSSYMFLSEFVVRQCQSVVFLVDKRVLLRYRLVVTGSHRLKTTIRATCYQCIRVAASCHNKVVAGSLTLRRKMMKK